MSVEMLSYRSNYNKTYVEVTSDAGSVVGQGGSKRVEGNANL